MSLENIVSVFLSAVLCLVPTLLLIYNLNRVKKIKCDRNHKKIIRCKTCHSILCIGTADQTVSEIYRMVKRGGECISCHDKRHYDYYMGNNHNT